MSLDSIIINQQVLQLRVVAQFESQNVTTLNSLGDYSGIGSNRRLS
jgi:hypothetical protein